MLPHNLHFTSVRTGTWNCNLFINALTCFSSLPGCRAASIVTVIRLVNDAVDDIESEGMKDFPLLTPISFVCVPKPRCLLCAVVWMKPSLCCPIRLLQHKTSRSDLQYILSVSTMDLSLFQLSSLGFSCLFVSVLLWLCLSLSLCSVKHGQRAEQPWWVRCKATEKHLINLPSLWLNFSRYIPKTPHLYSSHYCSDSFSIIQQTTNKSRLPSLLMPTFTPTHWM